MNIIQWKAGSRKTGDATLAYNELEDIRKKHGHITTRAVVERAKEPDNPLHRHFEWDDTVAADKHRLRQAGELNRSIEIIHAEAPTIPARVYSIITQPTSGDDSAPQKVYMSTEESLKDPVKRDEILGNAIRDAISYRRKYATLQELSKVFTVLDDFITNLKVG